MFYKVKKKSGDGLTPYCKDCLRKRQREYASRNRDARLAYCKKWAKENPDKVNALSKKWRLANPERHRHNHNSRHRERYKTDINYKLRLNIRRRTQAALAGNNKSKATLEMLGADIDTVRKHLESLFLPGMTWENHSRTGWHIDHIRPCASFDMTDPEQQKQCFHYTNLQPMWASDNIRKNDKF